MVLLVVDFYCILDILTEIQSSESVKSKHRSPAMWTDD